MEEKRKKQTQYAKEFKTQAVKLVLQEGQSVRETSSNLGVPFSTLHQWIKKFEKNGAEAFPGSGKLLPPDQKVRDLENQVRRLTLERDVLKKTIAYLSERPK